MRTSPNDLSSVGYEEAQGILARVLRRRTRASQVSAIVRLLAHPVRTDDETLFRGWLNCLFLLVCWPGWVIVTGVSPVVERLVLPAEES